MKKRPKHWLIFSGLAFQIGITMYLMIQLGKWIEVKMTSTNNVPTLICAFLGMIIILVLIQRQNKNR